MYLLMSLQAEVELKYGVLWDVTPYGSYKNRRFGGSSTSFIKVTRISELGTTLVTATVVPSSPILVTLMKEVLTSSETLVLTRATRRNIPEDDILHSHSGENLKSYIALTGWTL
jgi:hypothetical protein